MEREPRVWREVLGVVDGRREGVDLGVLGAVREEDGGESVEDEGGEESDEIMEIDAPETRSVGVE
ncbi:MAG: hypothetical protein Q9180_009892, partial [Flavoplaca navasiana]